MSEIKKYGYIDALRGIAILLVIFVHSAQHFAEPSGLATFLSTKGQYGVQLFFITSALTLFLSFGQRLIKDMSNTVKFFLIRRYFRIAPAYYVAILLYGILLICKPLATYPNHIDLSAVFFSIFFINGFFPASINYLPPGGWSVAIEMIFYFFIPFLFQRIRTLQASIIWFFGTILLGYLLNGIAQYIIVNKTNLDYEHYRTWYLYFWLPNQLPVFMLGIVMYHLLKKNYTVSKTVAYLMVAAAVALMISLFYFIRNYELEKAIPEHLVVAVLFVVVIFAMSQFELKLLENRVTKYLGKLSFSMYVWHFIMLDALAFVIRRVFHFEWNIQLAILYVVAIPATAFVSAISYERIELAGVKIGKRIIDRITANQPVKTHSVDVVNSH